MWYSSWYMQTVKNHWVLVVCGIIIAVLAVFGWSEYAKAPLVLDTSQVTATSTAPGASTTTEPVSARAAITPFPMNSADTLVSWSFAGAYAGNDTLTTQVSADIAHLTGLVGKGQYDDYDLYGGIANDYTYLGNGKTAYQYYNRAIQIHPNKGLAYVNLAHLMDELGAYHTAADAYAKATAVEAGMLEYHIERLNFLTGRFATNNAMIFSALADTSKQFGDNASILAIEAQWLTGQGRYADAIKAWQTVKMLSSQDRQVAVDAEIARLQAKQ